MSSFLKNVMPLKEVIYSEIKNKILNLEYKPGQMISETETSEILNVSRTPVREVFIRLSYEKLLDIFPQKGTFVSLIDMSFVEESVYMRHIVEKQIISEIIEKEIKELPLEMNRNLRLQKDIAENSGSIIEFLELDNEFHRLIFKAVQHDTIWDILSTTRIHYNRFRLLAMQEPQMISRFYSEHLDIMRCIELSDKSAYEGVLKKHNFSGLSKKDVLKEKYSNYFA